MQALRARRPDRGPSGLKPPPPCGAGISSSRGDLRPRQAGASPRWTRARRRPGRQQDELDVAGRAALPPDAPPPRDSGVLPGPVTWPVSHGDAGWDKSPWPRARASLPRPAPAGPFSGDGESVGVPPRGGAGGTEQRARGAPTSSRALGEAGPRAPPSATRISGPAAARRLCRARQPIVTLAVGRWPPTPAASHWNWPQSAQRPPAPPPAPLHWTSTSPARLS